jgi:hypothetical protein
LQIAAVSRLKHQNQWIAFYTGKTLFEQVFCHRYRKIQQKFHQFFLLVILHVHEVATAASQPRNDKQKITSPENRGE